MSGVEGRVTQDRIATFPIYRDGYPFTIREVHPHTDEQLFGMVTLRGESGEVIVAAQEVPRRLYRVLTVWSNGEAHPVTGSFSQPLTWTWTEANEWIDRCKALEQNAHLTFRIEVAA